MFPIVFPAPNVVSKLYHLGNRRAFSRTWFKHSSLAQYTARAYVHTHTHSLTVQWVEWQLPKRHAHVQITGTCVLASSQKEFFQMNFEMKSTWIIQIHWPVSFQEEGRGSLRQIQEEGEPRMTEPQARVYLKPPEAGRDKGAQSFQHLPRKQSWFWTFGLQNCEHTFLLF